MFKVTTAGENLYMPISQTLGSLDQSQFNPQQTFFVAPDSQKTAGLGRVIFFFFV